MEIKDNKALHRFEAEIEGHIAFVEYVLFDGGMSLPHTEVPKALGGKGIGSALVTAVLEYAKTHHLKVVPECSFIEKYIERHPEFKELVLKK